MGERPSHLPDLKMSELRFTCWRQDWEQKDLKQAGSENSYMSVGEKANTNKEYRLSHWLDRICKHILNRPVLFKILVILDNYFRLLNGPWFLYGLQQWCLTACLIKWLTDDYFVTVLAITLNSYHNYCMLIVISLLSSV